MEIKLIKLFSALLYPAHARQAAEVPTKFAVTSAGLGGHKLEYGDDEG